MSPVTFAKTFETNGMTLPIITYPGRGCFTKILCAMQGQLSAMLTYHCKVVVIRIDFHPSGYTADNKLMSDFIRKFNKRLEPALGLNKSAYVWVREIDTSQKQHYHMALMLNGNDIQQHNRVTALCKEIWESLRQPAPIIPENCCYMVRRNHQVSYDAAFKRISYLAKTHSKKNRPPTTNSYSTSRLKPKAMRTEVESKCS